MSENPSWPGIAMSLNTTLGEKSTEMRSASATELANTTFIPAWPSNTPSASRLS
jgi:hypothetical protein